MKIHQGIYDIPHPHRFTYLGLAAFNCLNPESDMNLREKQVYDNFLSAIDVIIREKPNVLVHAGDLIDHEKQVPGREK